MSDSLTLKVKNLSVIVDQEPVVHDVSFTIRRGQKLALVGPTGAGKSDLIAGILNDFDSNIVEYRGQVIHPQVGNFLELDFAERKQATARFLAIILQEGIHSLNPGITIHQQLLELVHHLRSVTEEVARSVIQEILEFVAYPYLPAKLDAYPEDLNNEEIQKVLMALTLIQRPHVIIADESVRALDTVTQKVFVDLLEKIHQELGISLLFVTNNIGLAAQICEDVLILDHGQIVERGKMTEILTHPQQSATQQLVSDHDRMNALMEEAQTKDPSLMRQGDPLLLVKDLHKSYDQGTVRAFEKVSFDLFAGESLGIVGVLDTGKTSLAKALTGIIPVDKGKILLEDRVLDLDSRKAMARFYEIQMIFQNPHRIFDKGKTIRYSLKEALAAAIDHKHLYLNVEVGLEFLHELMLMARLSPTSLDKYPDELDGQDLQKFSILRIMLLKPRVVVADEILSHFDSNIATDLIELLKRLQSHLGFGLIFISQNFTNVRLICDRVLVMKDGQIVEENYVADLLENPETDYTRKLMDALSEADESIH